ncbi:hypothetical protein IW261DRAFT_1513708 [Armillaria novae-zelandiae]|uniref:Uncharacterized protein n=1 Tax=Armillaria novae-zelandiae TaxID=153914 RepID=A0AA39NSJ5_9AGAR|nr:hypothetical protein IW261DRAFT_1513708 [Armillaria novae-zelandiae]
MEHIYALPMEASVRIREQFYPAGPLTRVHLCCDFFLAAIAPRCQTSLTLSSTSQATASSPAPKEALLMVCQVSRSLLRPWPTFSDASKFSAYTMGMGSSSYSVAVNILGLSFMLSIFMRSISRTALLKLLSSLSKHTGQLKVPPISTLTQQNTRHSDGITAQLTLTIRAVLTNFSMEARSYNRCPVLADSKQRKVRRSWVRTMTLSLDSESLHTK